MNKLFLVLLLTWLSACGSHSVKEGSTPQYTSAFVRTPEQVARLKIKNYTSAPLRVTKMVQLDIPLVEAFDLFAHRVPEWFSDIQEVRYFKNGVEASKEGLKPPFRRESLFKDEKLVERISVYLPLRAFGYQTDKSRSEASFPIRNHFGLMLFEADGEGGSLVTWLQYYDKEASIFYPLITTAYSYGMETALSDVVEKYGGTLVEVKN